MDFSFLLCKTRVEMIRRSQKRFFGLTFPVCDSLHFYWETGRGLSFSTAHRWLNSSKWLSECIISKKEKNWVACDPFLDYHSSVSKEPEVLLQGLITFTLQFPNCKQIQHKESEKGNCFNNCSETAQQKTDAVSPQPDKLGVWSTGLQGGAGPLQSGTRGRGFPCCLSGENIRNAFQCLASWAILW